MSKVLIIPDIHGRSFWKEPCNNWKGTIIFLGDYHDPYGEYINKEPTKKESRENLKALVEFVENRRLNNPGSVICLWGNHDEYYRNGFGECRADKNHYDEVRLLLNRLKPQIYYDLLDNGNEFLFSHAGITKDWLEYNNLNLYKLYEDFDFGKDCKYLDEIPYSRGGNSKYGSCIWNSIEDYSTENHIPEYYQIFGHTWGGRTKPIIDSEFAMLDCCKAFILDTSTKEIKEWSKDIKISDCEYVKIL